MLKFLPVFALLLVASVPANAVFVTGTPSVPGGPFTPTPLFGTLIDFDSFATGAALGPASLVPWGVSNFTASLGAWTWSGTQSMPNYVGAGASLGWNGTFTFYFALPANQVMIGIANNQGGPEFMTAYDASGAVLETYQAAAGLNTYQGISRTQYDIASFELTGNFFAFDDLQHRSIPEPGTLMLLATGLLGVGGFGWRKLRRS